MRDEDLETTPVALDERRQAVIAPPRVTERDEWTRTRLLHAVQDGDAEGEWVAQRWRLRDAWEAALPDEQHSAITRLFELAEVLDTPDLMAETLLQAAMIAGTEGRFADMEVLHGKARETGGTVRDEIVAWQRVRAAWETGDVDVGEVAVALEGVAPSIRLVVHPWASLARRPVGRMGQVAREFVRELGLDELPDDDGRDVAMCMASELAATAEDEPMCAALYERLAPYADRCAVDALTPRVWFGSTHLYLGMLAAATGELSAAQEHLERARYVHTLMDARCLLVRGEMWEAHVAKRRCDYQRAGGLLDSAGRAAAALGMRPSAEICRRADTHEGNGVCDPVRRSWQFRRDGATWLITTAQTQARIKDRKGVQYLHRLISQPRQELHVLDLAGSAALPHDGGSGPLLDASAKAEYRRRIEDLRDQVDEGERWGDYERVEHAQCEIETIAHEVSAAIGLGGRDRPSDAGERARVSVRKAIRAALALIGDAVPEVGTHLEASVRTGYYCAYDPDGYTSVPWGA